MRKVDDGKKRKEKKKEKKIMLFLVATNVVVSRPTDWNSARSCQKFILYNVLKVPKI